MKLTKSKLKQIIKEELEKSIYPQTPSDKEIFKMLDAGKEAAMEDGIDVRNAIRLASEYIEDAGIPDRFPNAHKWWVDNYGSWEAGAKQEQWMHYKRYSMR